MTEREIDKLLPKIAHLYYLEDMNQDMIAEKLNINRVRVSRYLKKAREKNIVEIRINRWKESHHDLERELEKRFDLKECIVISSSENPQESFSELADRLKGLLVRILRKGDGIGVNWGHTLKEVVALMENESDLAVKVVPIVGGMGMIEQGIHTNFIARRLADVLGGVSYVINAPAVLDSGETKNFLIRDSNTREIFKLWQSLSCAVFSFGDLTPESSHLKYGVFSEDEIRYLREKGIVGDVNLNFIDRTGAFVENGIHDRVITLPLDQLLTIRNRIGIACGRRKVDITRAVLNGGIVNILVVDREIAERIA
jgi:deoxyribonucleoside regulator